MLLSAKVYSQTISPIVYENQTSTQALVSAVLSHDEEVYACQLAGDTYGAFTKIIIEKYDLDHKILLTKSVESPFGALVSCHLFEHSGKLWFIGSCYDPVDGKGSVVWSSLNADLELSAPHVFEIGAFYGDCISISATSNQILIGGSLSSSPFYSKPFTLFLDEQMEFLGFYTDHTDAYDVESVLLFQNHYLLFGAGIWKYDMNHKLLNTIVFESPNEVAQTKSLKVSENIFFTLRRNFEWESGEWSLLLEKWNGSMDLLASIPLKSTQGIIDLNHFSSLVLKSEDVIQISAYSYKHKVDFPFVIGASSLEAWTVDTTMNSKLLYSLNLNNFHYPYSFFTTGNRSYIAGFFTEGPMKINPFLIFISSNDKLPVLEILPGSELEFNSNKQ